MNNDSPIALILRTASLGVTLSTGFGCNIKSIDVGDRPIGIPIRIDLYIHNLSTLHFESVSVHTVLNSNFFTSKDSSLIFSLGSGEVVHKTISIIPHKSSNRSQQIRFSLFAQRSGDDVQFHRELTVRTIFNQEEFRLTRAVLGKWKYCSQMAFVWRGDLDLFIPPSHSAWKRSTDSLEHSRFLMKRYRIPSTLALSGRLGLCQSEWVDFMEHYEYLHSKDDLQNFTNYLKTRFDFLYEVEYPTSSSDDRTQMELSNHMYLHYYNKYSACAENNWHEGAVPGQFTYYWERGGKKNSYTEQMDNCIKNREVIKECLDFEPKTYAAPYNGSDEYSNRAIEDAGILVCSTSGRTHSPYQKYPFWHHAPIVGEIVDAFLAMRSLNNPFHPLESKRLIECGYTQGDPEEYKDFLRLKLILKSSLRRHGHMVLLTHHQRLGKESTWRYFELFMRDLVKNSASGIWITSLYSLGNWWERVLCPLHKTLRVEVSKNENQFILHNSSDPMEGIPVICNFQNDYHCPFIVSCGEKTSAAVSLDKTNDTMR